MRIQATKAMAQAINKAFKSQQGRFKGCRAVYNTATPQAYAWHVGSIYDAEDWGDFNAANGTIRYITVSYPDDAYAMPRHLSTKDLTDIYRRARRDSGAITLDEFMGAVLDAVEV